MTRMQYLIGHLHSTRAARISKQEQRGNMGVTKKKGRK
jgi:hypothetical protein